MKIVKVSVEWKHGFKHSYTYNYPTQRWLDETKKHYDSLFWVKSVKFEVKEKK